MSLSEKKWKAMKQTAKELRLVYRFPDNLEKQVMHTILMHQKDNEDALETFNRLMQLAELKIQEDNNEK